MRPFPPPSPGDYLWVRLPKRWVRGVAIAFLAVLIPLAVFHRVLFNAVGDWLVVGERCEKADLLIVLAGDHGERLDHALTLYRRGAAPRLLLSGGPIMGTSWAEILKDQALRQGVPPEALWVQDRSTSTEEDARFCAEVLAAHPEVRTVCVVTSNYHSRRAMWVFRKAFARRDVTFISDPAIPQFWKEKPWWRSDLGRLLVFNEYVKLSWSFLFGSSF